MASSTTAGQNTVAKSLHDLGLATWFGGSLMGAVGLNAASKEAAGASNRVRVANAGWGRWTPVNLAAIAVHLLGGAQLTWGNKSRITAQRGVASATMLKTGLTLAALGSTAWARMLGQKVMDAEAGAAMTGSQPPAEDATTPSSGSPPDVEAAQRQLTMLQWAVPALTGSLVLLDAKMDQQQRPMSVARGMARRMMPR